MIVDGSYMAWVRPTRRVHLALSVGMTVTGVILAAVGLTGGAGAARTSPALGRSADAVMSGDTGLTAGAVPPAPLVRFAPPAPAKPSAKPHPKPGSPGRHAAPESVPAAPEPAPAAAPAPRHAARPSDVSRPPAAPPSRSSEPAPRPSSKERPTQPSKH